MNRRFVNLLLLVSAILFAFAIPMQAQGVKPGFELDGNALSVAPDPPDDWDLVHNGSSTALFVSTWVNDAPTPIGDLSIFTTGGSKDDLDVPLWRHTIGSVPDKDDITHAFAALYRDPSGETHLYFGADRYAQNGDAQIGFWFFQDSVGAITAGDLAGTFSGKHTYGDLLVLSDFTNGGKISTIKLYKWVGAGGSNGPVDFVGSGFDCESAADDAPICAQVNGSLQPSPWPYVPKFGDPDNFPRGGFFEGGINLSWFGMPNICLSSFMAETRASQSVDAVLKDFALGSFSTHPNIDAGPDKSITCTTPEVTLVGTSSTPGSTAVWTGPGEFTSTSWTITVSVPGTYTLTVTGPNQCVSVDPVEVILDTAPPIAAAGPDKLLTCTVTSVVLEGSSTTAGATFSWGGPGSFTSNVAQPIVMVPGVYTLTVTGPNGCVATDEVVVGQDINLPNVSAGPDVSLTCTTTTVTLTGSSTTENAVFAWSGPGGFTSAAPIVSVSEPGTYTLRVTGPNGCWDEDTVEVIRDVAVPNVTAGADKVLTCTTTVVVLEGNSTTAGVTYAWTGPGDFTSDAQQPSVSAIGTYVLTVTAPNGCIATDQVEVTKNETAPTVSIAPAQDLTCTRLEVTLTATGSPANVTYAWTGVGIVGPANGPSIVVNQIGSYTVVVTDPINGCTATDTIVVNNDIAPPDVQASADKDLTCETLEVTVSASSNTPNVTYAWSYLGSSIGTGASLVVSLPGIYTVTATAPNGCTNTDDVRVILNQDAPADVALVGGELTCTVTSIQLSASSSTGGTTYLWTGPGTIDNANTATPTVYSEGTYTCTAKNPVTGCTTVKTVNVGLNNTTPNVNAGADQTLTCATTEVTLTGSSTTPNAQFSWSGPGFTSTSPIVTVTTEGIYTLTITDPANGCTAVDEVEVKVNRTPPNVNAGADQTLTCTTTEVTLTGSSTTPDAQFSWSGPGFTSSSAIVTVTVEGIYTLTVTDPVNGCTATDTVEVNLDKTPPNVSAGVDQTLTCTTTEVTLTGSSSTPNATFSWSGPESFTSNQAIITVTKEGIYTLTVTNPVNGCTATDTVEVKLDKTPPNASAGEDQTITCTTESVTLTGSSTTEDASFSWTGPDFTSTEAIVTVTKEGVYTLTVTNPVNGCTATDTVEVKLDKTPPNVSAGEDQTITCTTESVTLTGSSTTPDATYSWSGPEFTSTESIVTVTKEGIYTLTVTNPVNGCTATDTVEVKLDKTPPNVSAGEDQTITCTATSATLTGSSTTENATFSWSGPDFTSTEAIVTVTKEGIYTLKVTNPVNGCEATDQVEVKLDNTVPNVDLTGGGSLTCDVEEITLTVTSSTPGVTLTWNDGTEMPASETGTWTRVVTTAAVYTVTATAPNGCTALDSDEVKSDVEPPLVYAGEDQTLDCEITTLQITATGTETATFCWTGPGITAPVCTATIEVTEPGTYIVTATGTNGCTATDDVVVTRDDTKPSCLIDPPLEAPVCGSTGNTMTTSVTDAVSYAWSVTSASGDWIITDGSATNTITYTAGTGTATFTLTVYAANGCEEVCTINVTCNPGLEFCSLTQGAYGSPGGLFNGMTTIDLITMLLTGPAPEYADNPLTVGKLGSGSLTIGRPAAKCIIDRLPAGSTPRAFTTNSDMVMTMPECTTNPPLPLDNKSGTFKSVLLGQVITLGLNLRLDAELSSFTLCERFTTQAALPGPDGLLGTEDDVLNPGRDGIVGPVPVTGLSDDPVGNFDVPLVVIDALERLMLPKTVAGLYELANRALAGDLPHVWTDGTDVTLTLSDINFAVNSINVGFDNCRHFLGCRQQ